MYDRPELRGALDRFWIFIRDSLSERGIDAPGVLSHDMPLWDLWTSPDLVLAQTCGFPFREKLHDQVTLVGTPDYDLPDCPPGYYNSVIVAHINDDRTFAEFDDACLAVNDPMSQSGWAAPQQLAQSTGFAFDHTFDTGSHRASITAIIEGDADLASIDAQTWRMMTRWDDVSALQEITRTPPTPGLPLITAKESYADQIADAVRSAISALSPEDRALLSIRDLVDIPKSEYLLVNTP
ncbi:phosphate/phosphite/phosphonate ABC transporter substrate-binding protein [Parasulfitobacter algicola]|nr:PhnD/SsuA/transferrin family substrate-binding protein [Sulfitobacter algicola]